MSRELISQMLAEMKRANEVAARDVGIELIDLNVISEAEKYILENQRADILTGLPGFDTVPDKPGEFACDSCAFSNMSCEGIPCEAEDRPDGIAVHFVKRAAATPT